MITPSQHHYHAFYRNYVLKTLSKRSFSATLTLFETDISEMSESLVLCEDSVGTNHRLTQMIVTKPLENLSISLKGIQQKLNFISTDVNQF